MRVGRTWSVRSLYCLDPWVKSTSLRMASYRLTWPLIMLFHVGALESALISM